MPQVQYRYPMGPQAAVVSKYMPQPKKVGDLTSWFKMARSVISTIPDPSKTDWAIREAHAGLRLIHFKLFNTNNEEAHVTIDRTISFAQR